MAHAHQTHPAPAIIDLLGGAAFLAATGARVLTQGPHWLQIRLPEGDARQGITAVLVRRDPDARYTMFFSRHDTHGLTPLSTHAGLHALRLQPVFRAETGLDTRLEAA